MKHLSKLVNKIYTSAERDISGERKFQLLNVFWRRLLLSFVGRLSWSSTSLCFAILSCTKNTYSRPAGHENHLLGPAATRIQIQVIAIQKFLYAVFTLQIMVRNVYDETPRYSTEVTFTL